MVFYQSKRRRRSLTFSAGLRALARYPRKPSDLFPNAEGVADLFVVRLVNPESVGIPATINEATLRRFPGLKFANDFRRSIEVRNHVVIAYGLQTSLARSDTATPQANSNRVKLN